MKKLYVGNLPYQLSEQELTELFADCGEVVSANIITDKVDNRSKGFGFVQMADDDGFEKALAKNGEEINGRSIKVSEARERQGGGGGGGHRGGGGGGGRRPRY